MSVETHVQLDYQLAVMVIIFAKMFPCGGEMVEGLAECGHSRLCTMHTYMSSSHWILRPRHLYRIPNPFVHAHPTHIHIGTHTHLKLPVLDIIGEKSVIDYIGLPCEGRALKASARYSLRCR